MIVRVDPDVATPGQVVAALAKVFPILLPFVAYRSEFIGFSA